MNIRAQQRFVVIDMETKVPLRDVVVRWSGGSETKTVWDGTFSLDSTLVEDTMAVTLTFIKPGYLERVIPLCDTIRSHRLSHVPDTIELLPSYNKLAEVVVWGTDLSSPAISFTLRPPTKDEIAEAKGPPTGASVGIGDVMLGIENLINHKKRKRTKKIKESLVGY